MAGIDEIADSVFREERDGLLRFAYLLCGDADLADDLVAESVSRAWPRLDQVVEPGVLQAPSEPCST